MIKCRRNLFVHKKFTISREKKEPIFQNYLEKSARNRGGVSSCHSEYSPDALGIYFSQPQKRGRKNPRTVAVLGFHRAYLFWSHTMVAETGLEPATSGL